MVAHLTNNMCLQVLKYKNRVFRERTVDLAEDYYLKDSIRRLSNDGDRFHPYIWDKIGQKCSNAR